MSKEKSDVDYKWSDPEPVVQAGTCQRCRKSGDPDLRTLRHACFYDMKDLAGVPFAEEFIGEQRFFLLRVCKDCRAEWMEAIEKWFISYEKKPEVGSGIWMRKNGTNVEVTREEYDKTR